jgi:peptide/nickel transport system substrate-binding protein
MDVDIFDSPHFVTGIGALAAGLAAKPRRASSQSGDILRVRLDQDLKTVAPGHALGGDVTIGYAIFNRLIRPKTDGSWDWELDAAQSFEVVDPTHFKFTLRPGIQFTNGFGEMTADDVKFSYERMADPATGAAYDDWHMLDRVDVTDRYSGVIVTKEPNIMVMSVTLTHYRSSILSRKAMESVGGSFTTDPPAVSGRYTIKEWVPKQKLTLVRNELWNGPQPDFDEIECIPI